MAADDSEKIEEALLRSLPPLVRSSLEALRPPHEDPTRTFELVGYRLSGPVPREDLDEAKRLLALASQPVSKETLLNGLVKVRVLTSAKQASDDEELQLSLEAYAEALAEYPGDAVRPVLAAWPRKNKWWPNFAELVAEIEPRCQRRRFLLETLNARKA
jgi:hypothetical protein